MLSLIADIKEEQLLPGASEYSESDESDQNHRCNRHDINRTEEQRTMIRGRKCSICGIKESFEWMYTVGGKRYCKACMEDLRKGRRNGSPSRIIIINSLGLPSHVGEHDVGHALVEKEGSWFLVIDSIEATNINNREQSFSYRLPEDFFYGMTYEKLPEALRSVVEQEGGDFEYLAVKNTIHNKIEDVKLIASLFVI